MLTDTFPGSAAARAELRVSAPAPYVPAARWAALAALMSFHCAGLVRSQDIAGEHQPHPWHTTEPGGCADTGATCLCHCHDKEHL